MGWVSSDVVIFDLGLLLQGQTIVENCKELVIHLSLVQWVWSVNQPAGNMDWVCFDVVKSRSNDGSQI